MTQPQQNLSCTALIPAYNEAQRIEQVLSILSQSQQLTSIVVVDDGSTDETGQVIKQKYPQVKLVQLEENLGKTEAVTEGLRVIQTDLTFLCDADLRRLQLKEIHQALNQFQVNPEVKMVILKRIDEIQDLMDKTQRLLKVDLPDLGLELKPKTLDRLSCLLSGERILETETLKTILAESTAEGYALEVVINQYLFEHQLQSCWSPSHALGSLKISELGILPFLNKYISMHFSLVQELGAKRYMQQLKKFCTQQCDFTKST